MPICMYPAIAAASNNRGLSGDGESSQSSVRPVLHHHLRSGQPVIPGEMLFHTGSNLITGHGTYRDQNAPTTVVDEDADGDQHKRPMRSSLTGRIRVVNKLVYVQAANVRYTGNVGDTVVGRITEVEQRRWKIDLNSHLLGTLALANVKLPGGELRRKSEDDERAMRSFMKEGDLVVAEVHDIYKDGSLQLNMPGQQHGSSSTGKLSGGCLLHISPSLVKRQKIHKHRLTLSTPSASSSNAQVTVGLFIGCNGLVWIGPVSGGGEGVGQGHHQPSSSQSDDDLIERQAVARMRNCLLALAANGVPIWESSLLTAWQVSLWLLPHLTESGLDDDDDDFEEDTLLAPTKQQESSEHGQQRLALLLRPDVAGRLASFVKTKLVDSL